MPRAASRGTQRKTQQRDQRAPRAIARRRRRRPAPRQDRPAPAFRSARPGTARNRSTVPAPCHCVSGRIRRSLQDEAEHDQQKHRQQRRDDDRHAFSRSRRGRSASRSSVPSRMKIAACVVDHLGAAGAAHVHADQFAFDGCGGKPLVPQGDRKLGELGEIAREARVDLRARSLVFRPCRWAGRARSRSRGARRRCANSRAASALKALRWMVSTPVAASDPDRISATRWSGAEIKFDQRAALRPVRGSVDQGKDEGRHHVRITRRG